jgi:acetyl esterase
MSLQKAISVTVLWVLLPSLAYAQSPKRAVKEKPLDPLAEMAASIEPTSKVVYKTIGDQKLSLHVFNPKDFSPSDRRTCFLVIHGGGWAGGNPRRLYPYAAHFASRGMVGISLEYRLANAKTGVTVFDCVKDGRSAVRYLRQHAAELGIDPDKIVVAGASAGGHIAAATALFDGVDEIGDDTKVSCVPNALVLLYPVIDTSKKGYGNKRIGERWRELSPVDHVRPGVPPTILLHGTKDTTTPFAGAKAFYDAMLKAGNTCTLIANDGAIHSFLMTDLAAYEKSLKDIESFLAKNGYR